MVVYLKTLGKQQSHTCYHSWPSGRRVSPDTWEGLGEQIAMALGGWGYSGNVVLPQASGFFIPHDLLKIWPTLMLGGSHFWRVRQTTAVALFTLPFFPFPGTEVVAVVSGFSAFPRLSALAFFLEADL